MNKDDKLRHIENIEKEMSSYCFGHCFNKKKFVVDFECVSTCYHKFLFSIKTIYETVEDEGRKYHSEYVTQSLGEEKRDRFKDHVFI